MNLVYQNIEESTFNFEVEDIKFYFSSSFNLKRFKDRCIEFINKEERKIINRYNLDIDLSKYFLISFYKLIEKRGFLIEYKNKRINKSDLNIVSIIK